MGFPTRDCRGPASEVARKQSPRLLREVSSLSRSWKRGSAPEMETIWSGGSRRRTLFGIRNVGECSQRDAVGRAEGQPGGEWDGGDPIPLQKTSQGLTGSSGKHNHRKQYQLGQARGPNGVPQQQMSERLVWGVGRKGHLHLERGVELREDSAAKMVLERGSGRKSTPAL